MLLGTFSSLTILPSLLLFPPSISTMPSGTLYNANTLILIFWYEIHLPFCSNKIWLPLCKFCSSLPPFQEKCSFSISPHTFCFSMASRTMLLLSFVKFPFPSWRMLLCATSLYPFLLLSSVDILCYLTYFFSYSSIPIFLRAFKILGG